VNAGRRLAQWWPWGGGGDNGGYNNGYDSGYGGGSNNNNNNNNSETFGCSSPLSGALQILIPMHAALGITQWPHGACMHVDR
jgi:hypothetical protein